MIQVGCNWYRRALDGVLDAFCSDLMQQLFLAGVPCREVCDPDDYLQMQSTEGVDDHLAVLYRVVRVEAVTSHQQSDLYPRHFDCAEGPVHVNGFMF